jgi:hypothetical protein
MWSLETLSELNSVADLKKYLKKNPLNVLTQASDSKKSPDFSGVDIELLEKVTGTKLVENLFVDSSGFGTSGEWALTYPEFECQLNAILEEKKKEDKTLVSCLTGIGQFQVYVGIFERNN